MKLSTVLLEEAEEETNDCKTSKISSEPGAGHDDPPDKDEGS